MVAGYAEDDTALMNNNRKLAIVSGLVVVVSIAVLAIAALVNDPVVLDPDRPEGAVQQYVQAVADEDWATARSFFTPELADRCTLADVSQSRVDNVSRVSIDDVSRAEGRAVVSVVITYTSADDPLSTSTWDDRVTFVLVDSGGWAFEEVSWPYFPCERFDS